jgi:hypothetical protein
MDIAPRIKSSAKVSTIMNFVLTALVFVCTAGTLDIYRMWVEDRA